MTAPLPNELRPEVVEVLEYFTTPAKERAHGSCQLTEKHGEALASYIESLHAERVGAVELPDGCPETTMFGEYDEADRFHSGFHQYDASCGRTCTRLQVSLPQPPTLNGGAA